MECINKKVIIFNEFKKKYKFYKFSNLDFFKKEFKLDDLELLNKNNKEYLIVSCNKCRNCIINKNEFLKLRVKNEFKKWKYRLFITLTYDDENNPYFVVKKDLLNFIKYLKIELKNDFKYFGVSEYGEKTNRPHYHLILFIDHIDQLDLKFLYQKNKNNYYTSSLIDKCWLKRGFNTVSFDQGYSLDYLLKYTFKNTMNENKNKFNQSLNNFKFEVYKKNIDGFKKFLIINNYIDYWVKNYFQHPSNFIKYSHGLGFVDLEKNYKKAPKYQLKKYVDNLIIDSLIKNNYDQLKNNEIIEYIDSKKIYLNIYKSFSKIEKKLNTKGFF